MPSKSLSRSSLLSFQKYSSLLAGNDPYIPFISDYHLLETEILTDPQASVTFSSLDNYASDYQHLQLRITSKTSSANGSSGNNLMRFNSDSGSNYAYHRLRAASDESVPASQSVTSTSGIDWGFIPRDNGGNGSYAGYVIDILDPFETTKYTTTKCFWGFWQASVEYVGVNSGLWMNTNALTSISFAVNAYSYATGSRFSLYGLKAA